MSRISFGTLPASSHAEPRGNAFRILVLGDFGGRASRAASESAPRAAPRKPLSIDRDNLDQVLARLDVGLRLDLPRVGAVDISFAELDDFHPDRLYDRLPTFASLRQLERQLQNPATFAAAQAEVLAWQTNRSPNPAPPPVLGAPVHAAPAQAAPGQGPDKASSSQPRNDPPLASTEAAITVDQLFDLTLNETQRQNIQADRPDQNLDIQALVREIAAPYSLPAADQNVERLVERVRQEVGDRMRSILHAPRFQALESAWRGIDWLVRHVDTSSTLHVHLWDVSQDELTQDLLASEDLSRTAAYKMLVEATVGTPGAAAWTLWVGNYQFGRTARDVNALGRLAKLASSAGAAFVASARDDVCGCASLASDIEPDEWTVAAGPSSEDWQALRSLPAARCVALAWPRYLLRLPYGKNTNSTERFSFEELTSDARHDDYLWGTGAILCAYVLARRFDQSGWSISLEGCDLDGLPAHVHQRQGDPELQPCAEGWLTLRAAEAASRQGLIPLLSIRDRGAVRLTALQSLATASRALVGRWSAS